MNKIIFFDTETTGLPVWEKPSDSIEQPHLTQIAAIVADADTQEVISSIDLTIKPDGWEVPEELEALNGLSTEYCLKNGVDERLAIMMFLELLRGCNRIVAHNSSFDQRILRIALKRYDYTDEVLEAWATKDAHYCTMRESKQIVGAVNSKGAIKNPNLSEAFKFFTGKELEKAHTALADTNACMEVYWALQNREPVEKAINF